ARQRDQRPGGKSVFNRSPRQLSLECIHPPAFDTKLQGALDVTKFDELGACDQSGGIASRFSAAGAPDAMDEVLRHLRQVIVDDMGRSEEHTSELQSPYDLVCRLLLEKKKKLVNQNANIRL